MCWGGYTAPHTAQVRVVFCYHKENPDQSLGWRAWVGIVQAIIAFLDFCYLLRREDFDEDTLDLIDAVHSLIHYRPGIEEYDAPNGICSSITEAHHITAVKRPWRRSSRYEALSQMLPTNQRLDKLAAARADFVERGMLPPTYALPVIDPEDDDGGPVDTVRVEGEPHYPRFAPALAEYIDLPAFPTLLDNFLADQLHSETYSDGAVIDPSDLDPTPISVFHSAVATFYAPSDPSGIRGMHRERIRSTPSWRKHGQRRDCAFAVQNQDQLGFRSMSVVRVKLSFSFTYDGVEYLCALVEWFKKIGRSPDVCTGMWVIEPEQRGRHRLVTILHLDSLLRAAHLIPVFGTAHIPVGFTNKYIDHHANEITF
ncbi:hypothetical protein C8R45DRAFT_1137267 [Mycena sanguinolenta]|nr:hypothetical protein C8R45DRAFT_1137267 [Mycena sanguinolenta]